MPKCLTSRDTGKSKRNVLFVRNKDLLKKRKPKRRVRFKAVIAQAMTWEEVKQYQKERAEQKVLTGLNEMDLTRTKTHPKGILKKSSYKKV